MRKKEIIKKIKTDECPSLSGKSALTYAIGKDSKSAKHLRLVANSGSDMFCKS